VPFYNINYKFNVFPVLNISRPRDKSASYVAWGHSIVCDPWSRVIRQCPSREAVAVTELDLSMVDSVRRQLPILSARREDVYRLTEL
jgi:omega-amidase